MSLFSLIQPPDEGLSLHPYPPFQGWCTQVESVKAAHQQWKRFLSCMPAAVDELHVGDVGLAAKAAATRGSRPTDSPHHSGGIEVHMDSPPTLLTTRHSWLNQERFQHCDENYSLVGFPCRRAFAAGLCRLFPQQGREQPAQPRCFTCN